MRPHPVSLSPAALSSSSSPSPSPARKNLTNRRSLSPLSRQRSASPDAPPPRRFTLESGIDDGGFAKRVNVFVRVRGDDSSAAAAVSTVSTFGIEGGGLELTDTRRAVMQKAVMQQQQQSPPARQRVRAPAQKALEDNSQSSSTSMQKSHRFHFDKVFDQDVSQAELYTELAPGIDACLSGRSNFVVIAAGATCSGKTHSILGSAHSSSVSDSAGILPRVAADLLSHRSRGVIVAASAVEIYCETVRDLLSESSNTSSDSSSSSLSPTFRPTSAMLSGDGAATTSRLMPLESQADADQLMQLVSSRTSRKTSFSHKSSRSHLIVTMHVFKSLIEETHSSSSTSIPLPMFEDIQAALHTTKRRTTPASSSPSSPSSPSTAMMVRVRAAGGIPHPVQHSQVSLVDLAGSEKLESSTSAVQVEEMKFINKSLSSLVSVVRDLQSSSKSKPAFRASLLTTLLASSLTQATLVLLSCINGAPQSYSSTLNSLLFANSFKQMDDMVVSSSSSSSGGGSSPTAVARSRQEAARSLAFFDTYLEWRSCADQVSLMLADLAAVAAKEGATGRAARWLTLLCRPKNGVLREHANWAPAMFRRVFADESAQKEEEENTEAAAQDLLMLAAASAGRGVVLSGGGTEKTTNDDDDDDDNSNFFGKARAVRVRANVHVAERRKKRNQVREKLEALVQEREKQKSSISAAEDGWWRELHSISVAVSNDVSHHRINPLRERAVILDRQLQLSGMQLKAALRARDEELEKKSTLSKQQQQQQHSTKQRGSVHYTVLQTTEAMREFQSRVQSLIDASRKSMDKEIDAALEAAKLAAEESKLFADVLSEQKKSSSSSFAEHGAESDDLPWFLRPGQTEVVAWCDDPVQGGHEQTFLDSPVAREQQQEDDDETKPPPAILRSAGGGSIGNLDDLGDNDDDAGGATAIVATAVKSEPLPALDQVASEHFQDPKMHAAFLSASAFTEVAEKPFSSTLRQFSPAVPQQQQPPPAARQPKQKVTAPLFPQQQQQQQQSPVRKPVVSRHSSPPPPPPPLAAASAARPRAKTPPPSAFSPRRVLPSAHNAATAAAAAPTIPYHTVRRPVTPVATTTTSSSSRSTYRPSNSSRRFESGSRSGIPGLRSSRY